MQSQNMQPSSQTGIDFLQQRAAVFSAMGGNPGGPGPVGPAMCGMPPAPPGYMWQAAPAPMSMGEKGQNGGVYMVALPALSSIFLPIGSKPGQPEGQQQAQWAMHNPNVFTQWVPAHQHMGMDQSILAAANAQASRGALMAPAPQVGSSASMQGDPSQGLTRKPSSKYGGGPGSPTAFDDGADDDEELTILPRRRAGEAEDKKRPPIVLTRRDLKELYGMQLSEAAARLDISTTAMKAVCRRAGIRRWPYRRIQCYKSRGIQLNSVSDEVLMMSKTALKRKEPIRTAASVLAQAKMAHQAEQGAAEKSDDGEA